ncbi:MAG: type II toxin-antitoxin system HicB family antitoxin [Chloroflexi bacterium]|nr:type II toxin-antitoxin system HicB family antitoxin [Chloroflexota bacterium]
MRKYLVVFERAPRNYSAYVPDLPGCVATGRDFTETKRRIKIAIRWHLEGLRGQGIEPPEPTSVKAEVIETKA